MRLLLSCDAVGGVWNHAVDLVRCLARAGHEVVLVSLGPPPSAERRSMAAEAGAHAVHHVDEDLEWMADPWQSVDRARAKLARLADEYRVDLVHVNSYSHADLPLERPRPVVIGAHSSMHGWWTAVRGRLRAPPATWENYRQRVREGLARADAVVAPTHVMLDELIEHYGLDPGKGHVVYNGRHVRDISAAVRRRAEAPALDPRVRVRAAGTPAAGTAPAGGNATAKAVYRPRFARQVNRTERSARDPPPYDVAKDRHVLWSGRAWDEGTGLATLDAAAAKGWAWSVKVAGSVRGPDGTTAVPAHVEVLGELDEAQYCDQLAASPIYVSTSLYEPFGLGPLDAAFAGAALVLPDIPSLREVWGQNARFYRAGDADALHAAVARLIRDQWARRRLARAAYDHACARYTADRMVHGMLTVYRSVLGGTRPGGQTSSEERDRALHVVGHGGIGQEGRP